MSSFETWRRKLATVGATNTVATPAPVVVDMADPRAAMREAGWGGEGAPPEAPRTGVGRGSRVAEAIEGDDWQAKRIAEAKAKRQRRP